MMKCTKSTKEKRSAAIRNSLIALAGMVAVFGSGALAQTPPAAPTGGSTRVSLGACAAGSPTGASCNERTWCTVKE